ncbi:MAG: hypothetical protein NTV36_01745, partial [Candidatus Staskawiczbacteria bacterium]|nr:hypothetical protein [Candidatus Staskawiczbacteria bacterium]
NTLCTQANASYSSPYTTMTCTYAVATGDTTRTVYCRTYDGTDYSTERTNTYTVDTTGPAVGVTTLSGFTTYSTFIKGTGTIVGGTATDIGGSGVDTTSCEYATNNSGSWSAGTWNTNHCEKTSVTIVNATSYIFNTRVKDAVANQGTGTITSTYTGDTSAPTTTDNSDTAWHATNQTITLSPTDGTGSGTAHTYYCVDTDNSCTPTTEGTSVSVTCASSTTCQQYVRYYSTDNLSNNESVKNSNLVKIDKEVPTTAADATPYVFDTWTHTTPVVVTLTCADGAGSGCLATLYCLDTNDSCSPNLSYNSLNKPTISTAGTSYIRYLSTDAMSNAETVKTQTIKIDTAGPSVNAGTDKSKKAIFNQDATVTAGQSPIATYAWTKVSGTGTITFGTPTAEDTTVSSDTEGTFVLRLTVTDQSNNSNADDFTLIWDTTNPLVNAGADQVKKAQFTQTGSATDVGGSGVASYQWSKVSGLGAITFGSPNSAETTVSASQDGGYVLRLTAVDNATNSGTDDFALTWDTTAPTTSDDFASNDTWVNSNQTITLIPADATSSIAWTKYCLSADCDPSAGYDYNSNDKPTITAEGTTYFRYASQDTAGNTQTTVEKIIKIDKSSPTTAADGSTGSPQAPYELGAWAAYGSTVNISLSCVDEGGSGCLATLYCTDTKDACTPDTPYTATPVPISTPGTSYIRYFSTDAVANAEETVSQTIRIEENNGNEGGGPGESGVAPILAEATPVSTPTTNTTPSYTFTSTKAGTITYGGLCSSANASAVEGSNTITFNTLSAGTYSNCTINVTDSSNHVSSALNITSFTIQSETVSSGGGGSRSGGYVFPTPEELARQIALLAEQIAKLFENQTPKISYPPIETAVPEEPQMVFQGGNIISKMQFDEISVLPLPEEIKDLAFKFPKFASTLEKVGISKTSKAEDVEKLKIAQLSFPSLSEVAGVPSSLAFSKFTAGQKQKIPSNITFAKTGADNIDFNIKVSISNLNKPVQSISTIQGKPLYLTVKPDSEAESVKGYIIFKSANSQAAFLNWTSKLSADLSASLMDATSLIKINNPQSDLPEVSAKKDIVLSQFDYKNNGGIWTAEVQAPAVDGKYEMRTVIKYKEKIEEKTNENLSMILVVDPEGYIYEKTSDNKETRIENAKVSIYWLNPNTKKYELWPAKDYQQENAQITDKTGKYSFLVPPGTYYLKVESPDYIDYQGQVMEVKEGLGIHQNIELKPRNVWQKYFTIDRILMGIIIVLLIMVFCAITAVFLKGRKSLKDY